MPATMTSQVSFRTVGGVRIRYADSGDPQKPAIVLISPWPESVYAFAPIWASLAEHARLFAVDLPGFGASERREDLLSPRAMSEFLVELIAEADLGTALPGQPPGKAPTVPGRLAPCPASNGSRHPGAGHVLDPMPRAERTGRGILKHPRQAATGWR